MGEHDHHRQRVYRRFMEEGLENFEEHNAMEFLLFLAKARGDTNLLAHRLIDHFGSLANVLDASPEEMQQMAGVGYSTAVTLHFIPQMCAYYLENKLKKNITLCGAEEMAEYFRPKFFGKTQEIFYMAALDDRLRVLRCFEISRGISNATAVSIARMVSFATQCHATGVVMAHNHPRGLPLPSSSDIACTSEAYKALQTVEITLHDHIIFGDNEYMSFAQSGYLENIRNNY